MPKFRTGTSVSNIILAAATTCALTLSLAAPATADPVTAHAPATIPSECVEYPSSGEQPALKCQVPSAAMGRDFSVLVRPAMTAANPKVALFLDGGDTKEEVSGWVARADALDHLAEVDMTLVFPVVDSWTWYQDWDGETDVQFETFLTDEVPTYLEKAFEVPSGGRGTTGIVGLSAGAYGAMNIASKNPSLYSSVYALSGIYNTQSAIGRFGIDLTSIAFSDRERTPWLTEESRAQNSPKLNVENLTMPVLLNVSTGISHREELQGDNPAAAFIVGGSVETGTFIMTAEMQVETTLRGMDNFEYRYDILGGHSWPTWRRAAFDNGSIWTFLERI